MRYTKKQNRRQRRGMAPIELGLFLPLFAIFIMFFLAMGRVGDTAIAVCTESRALAFSNCDGQSRSKPLQWPPTSFAGELKSGEASQLVDTGSNFGKWGPLESQCSLLDNPWDHRSLKIEKFLDERHYATITSSLPGSAANNATGLIEQIKQGFQNPMSALSSSFDANKGKWQSDIENAKSDADGAKRQSQKLTEEQRARVDGEIAQHQREIVDTNGELRRLAKANNPNMTDANAEKLANELADTQLKIERLERFRPHMASERSLLEQKRDIQLIAFGGGKSQAAQAAVANAQAKAKLAASQAERKAFE